MTILDSGLPQSGSSGPRDRADGVVRIERFDLARFQGALTEQEAPSRYGQALIAAGTVGSTQEEARAFARLGAPDGTVVIAESQSSGRGRRARCWESPLGGGVWATVILRRSLPVRNPALLTLAGSVALCEAVRERGVPASEIKWPNDLIVQDRKFAGLLGEMIMDDGESLALLGFGVNLDLDPCTLTAGAASGATALRTEGLPPSVGREELLASFLRRLEEAVSQVAATDSRPMLERWRALSPSSHGRSVLIDETYNSEGTEPRPLKGTTRGISPEGALLLEVPPGEIVEVRYGGTLRFQEGAADRGQLSQEIRECDSLTDHKTIGAPAPDPEAGHTWETRHAPRH